MALEDAGPADALAGRGTEGPGRGTTRTQRPSGLAKCAPRGATKSALEGLFPPASLWAKKVFLSGTHPNKCVPRSSSTTLAD